MGEELWPSPGEQARLLALSDAPISAYYVKGCGEGCMRGCVIRYFPPPGAYADLDELLGCEFGFLLGPWIAQV